MSETDSGTEHHCKGIEWKMFVLRRCTFS